MKFEKNKYIAEQILKKEAIEIKTKDIYSIHLNGEELQYLAHVLSLFIYKNDKNNWLISHVLFSQQLLELIALNA